MQKNPIRILLGLVVLLVIAGGLYTLKNYIFQNKTENKLENTIDDQDTQLKENEIETVKGAGYYLGEYENKDAILYLDNEKSGNGYVTTLQGLGIPNVSKTAFNDPIIILYNEDKKYIAPNVHGFIIDSERKNLYLSLITESHNTEYNKIIKISLSTNEVIEMSSHVVGESIHNEKGIFYIQGIQDNWLILSLTSCFHCDTGGQGPTVLLNVSNGARKYLGYVSEIKVEGNNVFYQKLIDVTVPCEPKDYQGELSPCEGSIITTKILKKPNGVTESLILNNPDFTRYSNPRSPITFEYPSNWNVVDKTNPQVGSGHMVEIAEINNQVLRFRAPVPEIGLGFNMDDVISTSSITTADGHQITREIGFAGNQANINRFTSVVYIPKDYKNSFMMSMTFDDADTSARTDFDRLISTIKFVK